MRKKLMIELAACISCPHFMFNDLGKEFVCDHGLDLSGIVFESDIHPDCPLDNVE